MRSIFSTAGSVFSNQGSTPTPWARGLRDQIQKWALQTQMTLYFWGTLETAFRPSPIFRDPDNWSPLFT